MNTNNENTDFALENTNEETPASTATQATGTAKGKDAIPELTDNTQENSSYPASMKAQAPGDDDEDDVEEEEDDDDDEDDVIEEGGDSPSVPGESNSGSTPA
jgi:hypothetical protein